MELLVVILIVVILSVATLSAVLPSFNGRRVSEGSRILQAALSRARDAAVRNNSPQGIRLLPDPPDPSRPGVLTCSRFVEMESGDAYDDGVVVEGFMVPDAFDNNGMAQYFHTIYSPDQYYPPVPGLPQYFVNIPSSMPPTLPPPTFVNTVAHYPYLVIRQAKTYAPDPVNLPAVYLPTSPTSWFYNIRQGEKFQLNDSGNTYTVAGPISSPTSLQNVDRLINYGLPSSYVIDPSPGVNNNFEFLFLVNGFDDDFDGFTDEGFDGIDNDGDGIIDPGFNGVDDDGDGKIDDYKEPFFTKNGGGSYPGNPYGLNNVVNGISYYWTPPGTTDFFVNYGLPNYPLQYPNEYEHEQFISKKHPKQLEYTIARRPVPSQGSRETALPTGVVIDLTTWNTNTPERSVLPVDPATFTVDIMVAPNGSVVAMDANANAAPHVNRPFFHFWLTELDDVSAPLWGTTGATGSDFRSFVPVATNPNPPQTYMLPQSADSKGDPRGANPLLLYSSPIALKKERRLLSLNTRTGVITRSKIEAFAVDNTQFPYENAERGIQDEEL